MRTALRFWTLLLPLVPAAGQSVWSPSRFWTHESEYAGSRICAGCHREIYAKQEASNHARSLRPPAEIEQLVEALPFRFADRASQASLKLAKSADGKLELEASKESESERIALEWAFG